MTLQRDERGFTLAELMVATMITTIVLGGAVAMTSQVQRGYRVQMEDAAAEQEGRYALDWISRLIRAAANNPFNIPSDPDEDVPGPGNECPVNPTFLEGIIFNPDGDAFADDIRIQTDANPPDGLLGGSDGGCNQSKEDVTISFDPATNRILFADNNTEEESVQTDAVIDNLEFIYKNDDHEVTANNLNVVYIEVQVRVRTRTIDTSTGSPMTRLLTQEVRIRGRKF
jgi:prepilin-type N-terminal cleavage/methylation domain-containing protein